MLTVAQFDKLEKQEVVEVGPLFPGFPDMPLTLTVLNHSASKASFTVTWAGVLVGIWTARKTGETTLAWEFKQ